MNRYSSLGTPKLAGKRVSMASAVGHELAARLRDLTLAIYAAAAAYAAERGVIVADPKFVRFAEVNDSSDLCLAKGSPAIDAGLPIPMKWLDPLREDIYNSLRFMRVYLKPQGKEADLREPLIVRERSTVGEVADSIHRDLRRKFRYSNVWGKSAVFPGQKVGVNHTLQEGYVLTIVARKQ